LKKEKEKLKTEIRDLQKDKEDLEKDKIELNNYVAEVDKRNEKQLNEIKFLEEQNKTLEKQKKELQNQTRKKSIEITEKSKQITQKSKEIVGLLAQIRTVNSKNEKLKSQIQILKDAERNEFATMQESFRQTPRRSILLSSARTKKSTTTFTLPSNVSSNISPIPQSKTPENKIVHRRKPSTKRKLGYDEEQLELEEESSRKKRRLSSGGVCYSWRDTGTCEYGNECRFVHGEVEEAGDQTDDEGEEDDKVEEEENEVEEEESES